MRFGSVSRARCRLLLLVAAACATGLAGCGTADVAAQRASASPGKASATAAPEQQQTAAKIADLLATYPKGSPCADVLVETPIAKVPPACAALWQTLNVGIVPGQNLLPRAPSFPTLGTGPGVTSDEAIRYATGLWRTEAFQGFAVGTRQLGIAEALGKDELFLRVGTMERAILQGEKVTTPICHFFPTQIEVVAVAPDFAEFLKATGRTLGVHARFSGPCYATATNAQGASRELFRFAGNFDVLFVGDLRSTNPLGHMLWITGLAECTQDIAKKTCAE